jgi:hypothetical protein
MESGTASYTPGARVASAARDLLTANPSLPLALGAIGALLVTATADAGYYPTTWYPATLFVIGLLAVGLLVLGSRIDAPRSALIAVGLLATFAAWSYLSIGWAENKGVAWDGANRAALYAALLALFALWRFDARGARAVLALTGLGIAGVGLVELLNADAAADPGRFFIDARFSSPAGYINANVALWALGLFPCLMLAASREAHPLLRGPALGGAMLLASLALLGQSRGWVLALPVTAVFYLLASPRRVRTLWPVVLVAAGTLAIARPILDVHDGDGSLGDKLSVATGDILTMAAAMLALGLTIAVADRAVEASGRTVETVRTGVGAVVALAVTIGLVLVLVEVGNPATKVSDAWDEFKSGEDQAEQGSSRFTTGGTNRYDFWTVAWDLFENRPLTGIGSENFQEEYLRVGSSGEEPRFPHSVELGVLSQTGLIGFLLFAGALGAAAVAAFGGVRAGPAAAAAAAAASATFLYWLLHASVDWFWEFPALTGPALALLGLAGALGARRPEIGARRVLAPRLAVVGVAAVALACTGPWLSARDTDRAADVWRSDLGGAYDRLDRARALNPLSAQPDLVAGTIALRAEDQAEAERRFRAALERQPRIGYALMELGVIAAERKQLSRARRLLRQAIRESPRNDIARDILAAVRRGRSVSTAEVNEKILEGARSRVE